MASPTIELSMIVKDGAAGLARCLASVAPLVDRMVIGDTGSTDTSVAIARWFGAEVVRIPWENDFARARNRVLDHARCDWVLVLDADEMLDQTAAPRLAECVAAEGIFAFDVPRWNYLLHGDSRSGDAGAVANSCLLEASRPYPAYAVSLNTRLFRRHPGLIFERPVHETVSGRVEALGLARCLAPFVIHHFGQVEDPMLVRQGKNEFYHRIGLAQLATHPGDGRTHFELGLTELEHYRRPGAALDYFEAACEIDQGDGPAWIFRGICLIRLGRLGEALQVLERAQTLAPGSMVVHEARGDACFHTARYVEAAASYRCAVALGGVSALLEAKLAATEVHLGDRIGGVARAQRALERQNASPELHDVVVATLLLASENRLAAGVATRRTRLDRATPFHFVLAASLTWTLGDQEAAFDLVQSGLGQFPGDLELGQALQGWSAA